jgi:hypothetical protein
MGAQFVNTYVYSWQLTSGLLTQGCLWQHLCSLAAYVQGLGLQAVISSTSREAS